MESCSFCRLAGEHLATIDPRNVTKVRDSLESVKLAVSELSPLILVHWNPVVWQAFVSELLPPYNELRHTDRTRLKALEILSLWVTRHTRGLRNTSGRHTTGFHCTRMFVTTFDF